MHHRCVSPFAAYLAKGPRGTGGTMNNNSGLSKAAIAVLVIGVVLLLGLYGGVLGGIPPAAHADALHQPF